MPSTRSITLAEAVAAELRDLLIQGDTLSGERLVEMALAQQMNVSQNTVRDALRLLEHEGWVVKRSRRGVYVRAFDRAEASELYALWSAVEGLALGWAMKSSGSDGWLHLKQRAIHIRHQVEAVEFRGALDGAFALHRSLSEVAGKPQTTEVLGRLHNQARLLENLRERRAPRGLHGWQFQLAAYDRLLKDVKSGAVSLARQTLDDLIMNDCKAVLGVLE